MRGRSGQDEEILSENPSFDTTNHEHYDDINGERIGNTNWCACNNCTSMPTGIESMCCVEIPNVRSKMDNMACIIEHQMIPKLCTDPEWARIFLFLANGCNAVNPAAIDYNRQLRKAVYCAFAGWVHGHLGRGDRRPIPSCIVKIVREAFPDPHGQDEGFQPSEDEAAEYMVLED